MHGAGGLDLRTAVSLLPTPRARDGKGRDPNPRGVDLNEAVALLPTPTARDGTGGGTPMEMRQQQGRQVNLNDWAKRGRSSGDHTTPPSAAGSTSSAVPRPGQLSLDELASD
jgi:hypothetical protein